MGKKKSYVGINIQFPISQLIVDGKKTIETRTYPRHLIYGVSLVIGLESLALSKLSIEEQQARHTSIT